MADRFRWDDFVLDVDAYRLERRGTPVPLEPKALDLLVLMVRRPDHLFTKQEIFDAVWTGTAVSDHALTRIVAQIRRALGDEAREARYLETVPTRGYRWICPVEASGAAPSSPCRATAATVASETAARPVRGRTRGRRQFTWAAVTGGIVLVAAAAAAGLLPFDTSTSPGDGVTDDDWSQASGPREVRWPVQLTTNPGLDLHPALSPLGDAVAFASDRSGSFEIYVRALDGAATELPLTSDGAQNVQPAWSPDGRLIAYHSYALGGIWVVPSRGGTPRQVAVEGSKPAWSPDGREIAYQSDEHADAGPMGFGAQSGSTLQVVPASGGDPANLTHVGQPPGGHAAPAWSPDGRFLTFTVFDAGTGDGLWLLDRQTGTTSLLRGSYSLFESAFSPDGTAIYVAGGDAFILRLQFDPTTGSLHDRGDVIPVPAVPGARGISLSPDGSHLAFAGLRLNSEIWAQPITANGTPAGPASPLTHDTSRRNSLPAVSPDGSRVAYMSARQGEDPNVWVMDVDGGNVVQLTSSHTPEGHPAWMPDGRRVAFLSSRGDGAGIWWVDVATRREGQLVDVASLVSTPGARPLEGHLGEVRLSGSMTRLAFTLLRPSTGRRTLYVSTIASFAPRPLGDLALSLGYPAWSPDERLIAVEIKERSSTHAGVLDVATGALRRLTHERGQTWVRSWSPDGRKIAAAVLRDGAWSLRWLAADGSGEGVITPPGPPRTYVRYPDWSRRGDRVVFERAEVTGNIWMLRLQ